jgi:glucodextranase-like protein
MRFRMASSLLGVALALSIAATALAQSDEDLGGTEDTTPEAAMAAPAPAPADAQVAAPMLFLQINNPAEDDVEVSLDTAQLLIYGVTLPGAVVSVDGDLADVDDQGNFASVTPLDEGANEVEVVASDAQGNQVSTTLYVTRSN